MALDLTDQSGNGNTLTNNGATEWTTDFPFAQSTEAVAMGSASSQYLTAVDSTSLSQTGAITIESWVKRDSLGANQVIVSKYQSLNNQRSFLFEFTAGNALWFNQSSDGATSTSGTSTGTVPTGVWTHLAVTSNNGTAIFYINGAADGTVTGFPTTIFDGTTPFAVGARYNSAGNPDAFQNGKEDEIRFWGTARTAAEISGSYNVELADGTTALSAAGLKGYWPLENTLGGGGGGVVLPYKTLLGVGL